MSKSKHQRKFTLIHFFLIVVVAYFSINGYHWWTFSKQFNKSSWIAGINDTDTPTIRKRMLKNIQTQLLQPGITQTEIIDMLGNSDTDTYFKEHDLVYWIGPDSSYIDSEWLVIDLDEEGKLVSTAVVTD